MNLREQNKQNNKHYIAQIAFTLFCEEGIENVSIPMVAKEAQVGTTSVYRYFESKFQLVVASAMAACQKIRKLVEADMRTKGYSDKTGMGQMAQLLETYLILYDNNRDLLKFVHQFGNYIATQDLDYESSIQYKVEFLVIKDYVVAALEKGIADGTMNKKINVELTYMTISDFILGFCSKIAYYELYRDEKSIAKNREQLALALDIACAYLKA